MSASPLDSRQRRELSRFILKLEEELRKRGGGDFACNIIVVKIEEVLRAFNLNMPFIHRIQTVIDRISQL